MKAGLFLVYGAWVPMILWQLSPKWAPRVLGEPRYEAMVASRVGDVISWVWFIGMIAAGFYLLFDMDIPSFLGRVRRKFGNLRERQGD